MTIYYKKGALYNPRKSANSLSGYTSVTTVNNAVTITTYPIYNKYSTAHNKACETMKNGILVTRKPQAKIFGEVELDVLKSLMG